MTGAFSGMIRAEGGGAAAAMAILSFLLFCTAVNFFYRVAARSSNFRAHSLPSIVNICEDIGMHRSETQHILRIFSKEKGQWRLAGKRHLFFYMILREAIVHTIPVRKVKGRRINTHMAFPYILFNFLMMAFVVSSLGDVDYTGTTQLFCFIAISIIHFCIIIVLRPFNQYLVNAVMIFEACLRLVYSLTAAVLLATRKDFRSMSTAGVEMVLLCIAAVQILPVLLLEIIGTLTVLRKIYVWLFCPKHKRHGSSIFARLRSKALQRLYSSSAPVTPEGENNMLNSTKKKKKKKKKNSGESEDNQNVEIEARNLRDLLASDGSTYSIRKGMSQLPLHEAKAKEMSRKKWARDAVLEKFGKDHKEMVASAGITASQLQNDEEEKKRAKAAEKKRKENKLRMELAKHRRDRFLNNVKVEMQVKDFSALRK